MNRRKFLHRGLVMPAAPWLLPFGTAACGGSSSPRNRYLEANFAPVETESTLTDLEVSGTLPRELSGRFLRNGPNPSTDTTAQDYHWFTGRGMVHGLRLREGRAEWYRNRFVGGNGANTNIIGHGSRTIAIVESGGVPQDLGYTLDTVGENTSIGTGYSAHPKLDPDTGALHAMCYDWAELQDHVRYVIVDAAGDWEDETDIPLPGMPMIHDMSLTANYAVIYDLPVTLSFLALAAGAAFPFRWDDEYEPRVGLLPRGGEAKDILWSPVSANYAYHPMNAYEDADGQVTIDIARYDRMFVNDTSGPFGDSLPRLDRWTINPHASAGLRKVSEQIVDERAQEFPRCHPGLNGKPYRYGYTVAVKDYGFPAIYKHDMTTGATAEYNLGAGRHSAEPVFVPKANAKAEDEGYLMTYVFDASNNKSEFVVLDAQDLARPALATVHLPARVPYGFHGNWVPDSAVGPT